MAIDKHLFQSLILKIKEKLPERVSFYGLVEEVNGRGEMSFGGLIDVVNGENYEEIIVGKKQNQHIRIYFHLPTNNTVIEFFDNNKLLVRGELIELYLKFSYSGSIIKRRWEPSDEIIYQNDKELTDEISINEKDFTHKIKNELLNKIGDNIQVWVRFFDEPLKKTQERLKSQIEDDYNLGELFFEGKIEAGIGTPNIVTTNGSRYVILFHYHLGAPTLITPAPLLETKIIADFFALINGSLAIQPKEWKPINIEYPNSFDDDDDDLPF